MCFVKAGYRADALSVQPDRVARLDGVWGILGMIAGAALYAEMYPLMKVTALKWGVFGKITLPQLLGVNHWLVIIPFVIGSVILFRYLEKKGL